MELAKEQDLQELFAFLQDNVADCLYLYIDVKKYGLDNPFKFRISSNMGDNLPVFPDYYIPSHPALQPFF